MPSPSEVFDAFISRIGEGRWDELADMYAEGVVIDIPLDAPHKTRLEGREAVRKRFSDSTGRPFRLRPHNIVVHTTGDPEVIIAEFDYEITHIPTGRQSTVSNIQMMRVRDGLIVQTRDYHDHLRFAALAGRAGQLGAELDAAETAGSR